MTERNEAVPAKVRGVSTRQIRGLPHYTTHTLWPARWPEDESAVLAVSSAGIPAGIKVTGDVLLPMVPVQLPPLTKPGQVRYAVKAIDMSANKRDEVMACLHVVYLDKGGQARELYTRPIDFFNKGDPFKFELPLGDLDLDEPLCTSLKITLMSEDEEGQKKHLLVRSVWVEVE